MIEIVHPDLIPVRARVGDDVVAYALVDPSDAVVSEFGWRLDGEDYAYRSAHIPGRGARCVYMHREIMGLVVGDGLEVDHFNGQRLDNRRLNLRLATAGQNAQNRRSHRGSSSSYVGVTWNAKLAKWQASGTADGRYRYLGVFEDEDEAGSVAAAFRAQHAPFSPAARERGGLL